MPLDLPQWSAVVPHWNYVLLTTGLLQALISDMALTGQSLGARFVVQDVCRCLTLGCKMFDGCPRVAYMRILTIPPELLYLVASQEEMEEHWKPRNPET